MPRNLKKAPSLPSSRAGRGSGGAPSSRKTTGAARDERPRHNRVGTPVTGLTPAMQPISTNGWKKLGFIPNVLKAYAFDMPKLRRSSPCTTTYAGAGGAEQA